MFDTHFDLLSIAYKAYLTNDYSYLEKIAKYFNENNVRGVVANLYFMSKDEMSKEICHNYYQENVPVLEMFKKAKEIVEIFFPGINIVYSIEGADYINGPQELEELYNAGLDALILCWNTENRYGSGNRGRRGLTLDGEELLNKAIDLGMGIDVSHANKRTFYNMLDLVEKREEDGDDVCLYASHSNARALCNRDRNLDDDQLRRLGELGGMVGLFAHKNFVANGVSDNYDYRDAYLKQIDHVMGLVGVSHIMVATDDMNFCVDKIPEYKDLNIYEYSNIGRDLGNDLLNRYGVKVASRILYDNVNNNIFNRLKIVRNEKGRGVK